MEECLQSLETNKFYKRLHGKPQTGEFHNNVFFFILDIVKRAEVLLQIALPLARDILYCEYRDLFGKFPFRPLDEGDTLYDESQLGKIKSSFSDIEAMATSCFKICSEAGVVPTQIDQKGQTPLIHAIDLKYANTLPIKLLQIGADPNQLSNSDSLIFHKFITSPLVQAAANHFYKFEIVDALLNYGADPDFRSYYLSKTGEKYETNKALNRMLHTYIAGFEFKNVIEFSEHKRVKNRLKKQTNGYTLESIKAFFRDGWLVLPPKDKSFLKN